MRRHAVAKRRGPLDGSRREVFDSMKNWMNRKKEAGAAAGEAGPSADGSASTSGPEVPPGFNPMNPVGNAKLMWQTMNAARAASKQAHPEGGAGAWAESNVAQMRALLDLQKRMATQMGDPAKNPTAKMMQSQTAMLEGMLGKVEAKMRAKQPQPQHGASTEATSQGTGAAANEVIPEFDPKTMEAMMKQMGMDPKAFPPGTLRPDAASPAPAASNAAAVPSATASEKPSQQKSSRQQQPQGQAAQGPNLGAEVEALFAELRALRESKNRYRARAHEAEAGSAALREQVRVKEAAEADLRKRLGGAEQAMAQLQAEAVGLRESARDVASLRRTLADTKGRLADATSAPHSAAALERELHSARHELAQLQDDTARLQRKLRRQRRATPLVSFSRLLNALSGPSDGADAAAATATDGAASPNADVDLAAAALHGFRPTVVDAAFAAVREQYEAALHARFEADSVVAGAPSALLDVACESIRSHVAFALLDCAVTITATATPTQVAALRAALEAKGFIVSASPHGATELLVAAAAGPAPSLGPYGVLHALVATRPDDAAAGMAPAAQTHLAAPIAAIAPTVSPALLENTTRVETAVDRARSSKPGGQASNVGETKITQRLFVDGKLFATSIAQDSRSAVHNVETAAGRLLSERVPAANAQLRALPQPRHVAVAGEGTKLQQLRAISPEDEAVAPYVPTDAFLGAVAKVHPASGQLDRAIVTFAISLADAAAAST
jgi:hypothetical protein